MAAEISRSPGISLIEVPKANNSVIIGGGHGHDSIFSVCRPTSLVVKVVLRGALGHGLPRTRLQCPALLKNGSGARSGPRDLHCPFGRKLRCDSRRRSVTGSTGQKQA